MSDNDDNETQGVVFGVLAGVIFGVIALVAGLGMWKASQPVAPAAQVACCRSGNRPGWRSTGQGLFCRGQGGTRRSRQASWPER